MKSISIYLFGLVFITLAISCNTNNVINVASQSTIERSKPSLMVFPSDAMLKRMSCISEIDNQGTISYIRDYKKAYINDSKLKFVIASIEELFAKNGYPIENLEQQLKQLDNENATDEIESLQKDPKTILMSTARPDFIIEIDYEANQDPTTRNLSIIISYILTAIDVYTNKTVASITQPDIKKPDDKNFAALIKENLDNKISDFQSQLSDRFNDISTNGAEITLRITVDGNANLNLGDECLGSENYNDWLNNWLKSNTVDQTYKPIKNTNSELRYTNIRIKSIADGGKKYTAYDFANDLKKDISKACGILASNKTQSIGDAYLTVKGLK